MSFSFLKLKNYTEYLPILLITLLFITDSEVDKHALSMSCQMVITIICAVIFFLIVIKMRKSKLLAFITAGITWVILVYIKRVYIIPS